MCCLQAAFDGATAHMEHLQHLPGLQHRLGCLGLHRWFYSEDFTATLVATGKALVR